MSPNHQTWAYRVIVVCLLATNLWILLDTRDTADQARRRAIEATEQASYCIQR